MGQPIQLDEIPLQPILVMGHFERWDLGFVGLINPLSQYKSYILV